MEVKKRVVVEAITGTHSGSQMQIDLSPKTIYVQKVGASLLVKASYHFLSVVSSIASLDEILLISQELMLVCVRYRIGFVYYVESV